MKIIKLLLFLFIFSSNSSGQDSPWEKEVFNEILTLKLPKDFEYTKSTYVEAFDGEKNSNYYGFQYYDTIFVQIADENAFQISLTGFISGRVSDPDLKKYNVTVIDTSINSTKGLMAKFTTNDTTETYRQIYYFVTMANNQYYWFYAYTPLVKEDEEVDYFFQSILFNNEHLKEKSFKLTPVHLQKNVD